MKQGQIPQPMWMGDAIPLVPADLDTLKAGPRRQEGVVTRIRNSHHNVARLFAFGLKTKDIAEKTGYTAPRVSQLVNDPAMQELIALYKKRIDDKFVENVDEYMALATSNMVRAERHISDKIDDLEDEGNLLGVREALAISRDAADRFGYGKHQTNLNVNADFASMLEKAIKRSGKVIEGTHTVQQLQPSPPPVVVIESESPPFTQLRRRA